MPEGPVGEIALDDGAAGAVRVVEVAAPGGAQRVERALRLVGGEVPGDLEGGDEGGDVAWELRGDGADGGPVGEEAGGDGLRLGGGGGVAEEEGHAVCV